MEIGDNITTAIGYICATIILVSAIVAYILFWISLTLPNEYVININITTDDNLLNMTKTAERMQEKQLQNKRECWENDRLIPCANFTNDEHFCSGNICKVNGICPDYYEKLNGITVEDCIRLKWD